MVVAGGLLAGALVLGLAADRDGGDQTPLDPRSDTPSGTSALVALVRELGADVRLGERLPSGDADVALVLRDRLGDAQRDDLLAWAAAGGTLVVSDPGSPLAPSVETGFDPRIDPERLAPGSCGVDSLRGLAPIAPGEMVLLEVDESAEGCFGTDRRAFVVVRPEGEGTVVAIGGADLLTNGRLGDRDNAVLAAALVAPTGGERVRIVEAVAPIGGGDRTLVELVPDRVWRALVQLGLAFGVYAAWRAIRLGRPVEERQPVAIAGSELVEATGRLLERTRDPARAAELVRADLRLAVARRLGVPPRAGLDGLVRAVTERTGVDEATARTGLADTRVANDDDLVAVARAAAQIRQEILA